jgi:hypothetical protein
MCDQETIDKLGNGHMGDPKTHGEALRALMIAVKGMQGQVADIKKLLKEIPTRSEVREINHSGIQTHLESCSAARKSTITVQTAETPQRKQAAESNEFDFFLGKWLGLKAKGRAGVWVAWLLWAVTAIIAGVSAPYIKGWINAWFSHGG